MLLSNALTHLACVFHEDGQWVVSHTGQDVPQGKPRMSLKNYARYGTKLYLLFEDAASIRTFLADDDEELEPLQQFVRRTRRYRNVIVLTVRELRRYSALEAKLSRMGTGFWVETLGAVTIEPHPGADSGAAQECLPGNQWGWRATVEQDYPAYWFERMLINAETLIDARLRREPRNRKSVAELKDGWAALGIPENVRIDRDRPTLSTRTMTFDLIVASSP